VGVVVVVAEIAILALVVTRNVRTYADRTNVLTTKTQMIVLESAITDFRVFDHRLPVSLSELVGPQGYLDSQTAPTDAWGHAFVSVPDAEDGTFDLRSLGRDEREGGSGQDADIDLESAHRRG